MLKGLFQKTYKKVTFEDLQIAIKTPEKFIIINTLPISEQDHLIKTTISIHMEERIVNELLNLYDFNGRSFIIYGKHVSDTTVESKYDQLCGLGFSDVYMYPGGLFEWVLLQDIYGFDEFPTTKRVLDILKYKPVKMFGHNLLTY